MRIDAELAPALARIADRDLNASLEQLRLEFAATAATLAVARNPDVEITETAIVVAFGHAVEVRIYRPARAAGAVAGVVFCHGGGFAIGDLESGDSHCQRVCARLGVVVINVDYRLAPEHPFPAGLEDCFGVLEHAAANADDLGIDATRLAVAGASSGGCFAAALALMARDRGGPALAFQCLLYPALDDTCSAASIEEVTDSRLGFAEADVRAMWPRYLAGAEPTAYAAPTRATSLAGLPPAHVLTLQLDPLRDEGLDYARRLIAAGVPTTIHHVAGAVHAFGRYAPEARLSVETDELWTAALGRGLSDGYVALA